MQCGLVDCKGIRAGELLKVKVCVQLPIVEVDFRLALISASYLELF